MSSTKRLTEQEISDRLVGRGIELVAGSFKNIREPARWTCLVDPKHGEFSAPPKQIIHANGSCPLCGKVNKLTEEIVELKIEGRPLSLLPGTLKGSDKKAQWKCLSDSSHPLWFATPSSVINSNSGCPVCSGKLPLTEDAIRLKLKEREITLVEETYDSRTKTAQWKCLSDTSHPEWRSSISSVIYRKTGCPICAGNAPITLEQIEARLKGRPIELVQGSFGGGVLNKAMWRCLVSDEHPEWSGTTDSVLRGSNCPACTGHERLTPDVVRRKIKDRSIELISDSIASSAEKVLWGCKADHSHRNWAATVSSVLAGSGCPQCSGNARLNETLINERLNSLAIRIVEGTYKATSEKAEWMCLANKDHLNWFSNVGSILSGVGCPNCAEYGFDENKQAYLYLMLIGQDISPIGIKCGITNNDPKFRLQQIRRKASEEVNLIKTWTHPSGRFIRGLEKAILENFSYNDLGDLLKDGGTETLYATDLTAIVNFIEQSLLTA
jgi:Zn ribbon nucleic-acid-binding protein